MEDRCVNCPYTNIAWLGIATTKELLEEIAARLEMSGALNYSTVKGE